MALNPVRNTAAEYVLCESTTSIATTPVNAVAVAPVAGYIVRVGAAADGTTTGTIAVTVKVNGGSDIANGGLNVAAGSGSRNGAVVELPLAGTAAGDAVFVAEGDCIEFAPSGGTGSSIQGAFFAVIRAL